MNFFAESRKAWTAPAFSTELETSSTSATLMPHLAGKTGLFFEVCQIPPDVGHDGLLVVVMKSSPDSYVFPACNCGVRNW